MAKIHWTPKPNEFFKAATVPGNLVNVDFMVKDSKRFADSGGWGYSVFDYDAASDTFNGLWVRFGDWRSDCAADGTANENVAPGPSFGSAHKRP
jgi:hypothetical protein